LNEKELREQLAQKRAKRELSAGEENWRGAKWWKLGFTEDRIFEILAWQDGGMSESDIWKQIESKGW
jgi:hypothetical protein